MATFKQYEKKDNTTAWQFQAYLGINETTGKPVKTTRRNFKTKKEAQLALNRLLVSYETEGLQKQNEATFKEVYELWYQSYEKTVRPTTGITTERYIKNHVLPMIGNYKVRKIDVKTAQKCVNNWAESLQVYRIVLQYVIKIMDYAITLKCADENPFNAVLRPKVVRKKKEKEVKYYTPEQIQQVLEYLENKVHLVKESNVLYRFFAEWDCVLYRVLAFTGLRAGEALSLNFSDIDFENKTLTVNKTLSKTRNGYVIAPPKTKSSNRTIALDDKTVQMLKKWRLRKKEIHFKYGAKQNEIVFSDCNGDYSNTEALFMRSNRIADFVGLPRIGTHGWRHSHASLLYSSNVPLKEAQQRLGHSSLEITNSIYTHLSEKQKRDAVEKLAKFANF